MATASELATTLPVAQEWKDLLEDLLPPQGTWSEEEYLVLTDHRRRLVEFTDGFLEALPRPTDKHQSVLQFLFLAFFRPCNCMLVKFISPRCGCEFGQASSVSPIFFCCSRQPIRAGKTASGSAPISLWKWLVKKNRNGTWLTSGAIMPRGRSRILDRQSADGNNHRSTARRELVPRSWRVSSWRIGCVAGSDWFFDIGCGGLRY